MDMTEGGSAGDDGVFAVVTGGGTSGHVVPALALLEALEDEGHHGGRLAFVGCRRGVDRRLLDASGAPARGVRCEYLPISGLQRGWGPRALGRNIALPLRILRSRRLARTLIRRWRPAVVVSVGGYASAPMSHAALAAGVPLVCVSYDRIPGLATRLQARRATACAVAFADSELPRARLTGAPVRRSMREPAPWTAAEARRLLDLPEQVTITVVGGSLGSGALNNAVEPLLASLGAAGAITVLHLCGERFERQAPPPVPEGVTYVRRGYESRMSVVYAATDVLVSRAGASTVAEIAACGVCAVLVPWAASAEDHQRLNAAWLGDAGAAVIVDETAVTSLPDVVSRLLADPERRHEMGRASRALGENSRSTAIVRLLEECAGPR